jgi:hypothetical protein
MNPEELLIEETVETEVTPVEEQKLEQVPETPVQAATESDDNVTRLRRAKQNADRERDEAIRQLSEFRRQQAAPVVEEDEETTIDPEDLVSGKQHLKLSRQIQQMKRDQAEQIERISQQAAEVAAASQLRYQYPDIDKVINAETVARLREEYPELASSINSNPDVYAKSVAAYTMIKRLGLSKDTSTIESQVRLNQNVSKPQSSAAAAPQRSDSPLSQVNAYQNGLTKEMKQAAAKELSDILRG